MDHTYFPPATALYFIRTLNDCWRNVALLERKQNDSWLFNEALSTEEKLKLTLTPKQEDAIVHRMRMPLCLGWGCHCTQDEDAIVHREVTGERQFAAATHFQCNNIGHINQNHAGPNPIIYVAPRQRRKQPFLLVILSRGWRLAIAASYRAVAGKRSVTMPGLVRSLHFTQSDTVCVCVCRATLNPVTHFHFHFHFYTGRFSGSKCVHSGRRATEKAGNR